MIETLKKYLKEDILDVPEAIWLSKNVDLKNFSSGFFAKSERENMQLLLQLIKNAINEKDKSFEDELYFFSITRKLQTYIALYKEYEEEDKADDVMEKLLPTDVTAFNSRDSFAKLNDIEKEILETGHAKTIEKLISFIKNEYPGVLNGFNRNQYSRVKGTFWKTLGLQNYSYYLLTDKIRAFLMQVYTQAEPVISKMIEEQENELLPDITAEFRNWLKQTGVKITKTNLREFLKNKNIKLSTANIDKVLKDTRNFTDFFPFYSLCFKRGVVMRIPNIGSLFLCLY